MVRILIALLFAVSLANTQIIESAVDTTPAAVSVPAAEPVITGTTVQQRDTESIDLPVVEEPAPAVAASTETQKTSEELEALFKEGAGKKKKGTVLSAIGGAFIGFASVYTILFFTDNEAYGIPLGSTTSGNSEAKFYLNPGFLGLPIGIPCLVTGIINSSRGRNMIEEARKSGYQSSVKVQPYMYYSMKQKETGVGLVLGF